MISAALTAFEDVTSPKFRNVLSKSIGLTILLFLIILISLEIVISVLTAFPWPWLETVLAIATGLGVFAALFFLMAPVTAIFAGIFLDEIAEVVEIRHYSADIPGTPLSMGKSALYAVQFGSLILLVNLILLPTLFFGIGAFFMVIANAYLLGREYFTMVAMRHLPANEVRRLWKSNWGKVFAAGLVPACLALVPMLNVLVPIFSTSYFVHIFKKINLEVH